MRPQDGSAKDYRASQWPLLRHLIERRLKKAIRSARWTAGQKRRKNKEQQKQIMNESEQWQQHRAFGAVDWAREEQLLFSKTSSSGQVIAEPSPCCEELMAHRNNASMRFPIFGWNDTSKRWSNPVVAVCTFVRFFGLVLVHHVRAPSKGKRLVR